MLLEGTEAGARAGCASPEIRILLANRGPRLALPRRRDRRRRRAGTPAAMLGTGESTSQTLALPAGRWNLSLQYFSPFGLTLSAPGFRADPGGGARRPAAEHDQPRQQRPVLARGQLRQRRRPGPLHGLRRRRRAPCRASAATTARPTSASWSPSAPASAASCRCSRPATSGSTGTNPGLRRPDRRMSASAIDSRAQHADAP